MSQSVEQKKANVLEFDPGAPKPLPFECFNNQTRKSTKLVNNVDESNFMQGRNHAYWFELKDPMYLNQIEVDVEGYAAYKKLEFRWKTQRDTTERSANVSIDSSAFIVVVNDVVSAFCLKPPPQHFSEPRIKAVRVWGVTLEELDKVMEEFGNLDETKAALNAECDEWTKKATAAEERIQEIQSQKQTLTNAITKLKTEKSTAVDEAAEAQAALEKVEVELVSKRTEVSDLSSRLETVEDNIDQKKKESESLNTEIAAQKRELKTLKDDVNLFPTEISGYVAQGAKNVKHYALLSLIPVLLLVLYTGVLFGNAVDLSTVYRREEGVDLWTMVVSRAPFAIISIFIIHACYKIIKMFILEVIRINNRRLDLTKVSIVAKDVSDTASRDLNFGDSERYELNTKLKMDMLKSHLKGYVADDYEHDIEISLWERFKKGQPKKQPQK